MSGHLTEREILIVDICFIASASLSFLAAFLMSIDVSIRIFKKIQEGRQITKTFQTPPTPQRTDQQSQEQKPLLSGNLFVNLKEEIEYVKICR